MFVEIAFKGEGFVASLTFVWLLGGMGLHVSAKIRFVGERFRANVAFKRLLPGVSADVTLQQPGTGESFAATVRTFASFRMGLDVHSVGRK